VIGAGQQLALELGAAIEATAPPADAPPAVRRRRLGGAVPIQESIRWEEPPRTARHRPVGVQREDAALYRAVETLRAAGRRVYRAGALHRVDGRLLTTAELLRLARADRRSLREEITTQREWGA